MTDHELLALHEAAHAVVGVRLGLTVRLATIIPCGDVEGRVSIDGGDGSLRAAAAARPRLIPDA